MQLGANSGLHIIIFDELDAICKQRGTSAGSTGVHDTVVNQLLSKIDGVEQLNNILVIGKDQQLFCVQCLVELCGTLNLSVWKTLLLNIKFI